MADAHRLLLALDAVLPYAESRAEDMRDAAKESGSEEDQRLSGRAWLAVERAQTAVSDGYRSLAVLAGWKQGGDGDIWWHASHGSWKHAVSWGRTYGTARDVVESDDYPFYECNEG